MGKYSIFGCSLPRGCQRAEGFSIVELMVVLTIMSLMSAIGVSGYRDWNESFKKATALS